MSTIATKVLPPERISTDPIERKLYSRDVAPVPEVITGAFLRTTPDAVVRPGNSEQVAALLREATRARVPVTTRAAASTGFYNTVPVRGGLVLDVNDLRGVVRIDTSRKTVRVLPATTWQELDDALSTYGLATMSYPSSAVSATVGGWISTQGHGIGSLRYGAVADQLVELEVALPDGRLIHVDAESFPPMGWFPEAEGTLGVITAAELSVRPRPEAESIHLLIFEEGGELADAIRSLARWEPRPFTLTFADPGYFALLSRAGFRTPLDPTQHPYLLLACFQGDPRLVGRARNAMARLHHRELPPEMASEEWGQRLYHLRVKRAGPSLLAAELWMPLSGLAGYLRSVARLSRAVCLPVASYGVAVSQDWAMVMSVYPADERRKLAYLCAIGFTKRLHDLGARNGGRPYGVGLWNTAYLPRLFDRDRLAELRSRKAALDPAGIMNPGKLYGTPLPLRAPLFGPASWALSTLFVASSRRRQ